MESGAVFAGLQPNLPAAAHHNNKFLAPSGSIIKLLPPLLTDKRRFCPQPLKIPSRLQLDRKQCCFPPNLSGHTCKHRYKHAEYGSAITWDDAIQSAVRNFDHKSYNLFTCNSHSFVANCLNRICYDGSMSWNMIDVAALILFKGT